MKKYIIRVAALLSFVFVVSIASSHAQTINSVRINIPFDFQIGDKQFEAGNYRITRPQALSGYRTLELVSLEGHGNSIINSSSVGDRDESKESGMVFNRYEDVYFLTEINFGSKKITLPRSSVEKELVGRYGKPQTETVVIGF